MWIGQSSSSHMWIGAYSCILRASDSFLQCKNHYASYIKVGAPGWRICSQSGDGVGQVDVGLMNYWMGCDGSSFAVGSIAKEGFFTDSKGSRTQVGVSEDLAEVGWSLEFDSGYFFRKLWIGGGFIFLEFSFYIKSNIYRAYRSSKVGFSLHIY